MRSVSLIVAAFAAFCYAFICYLTYDNASCAMSFQLASVSNDIAVRELRNLARRDSKFFRSLAERLQYFEHDPALVQASYQAAIQKGPADFHNFLSYARYLAASRCCDDRLSVVLTKMNQRCPADPKNPLIAAELLLAAGNNVEAVVYLKRAVELGVSIPPHLRAALP